MQEKIRKRLIQDGMEYPFIKNAVPSLKYKKLIGEPINSGMKYVDYLKIYEKKIGRKVKIYSDR